MTLVAGVDSSTQSCKVVVRDATTGALVRTGRAPHPGGTEVHPDAWWRALGQAVAEAGGLDDVAAVAVAGQQHGMICLDASGTVVRPALLWNDTRSAAAGEELVEELGGKALGRAAWAEAVGSVPVASFTVTKLRWLKEHEPDSVLRTEAVCLPHDWLTWRLAARSSLETPALDLLTTDRSEASGTGYWSPSTGSYRLDLLERALGRIVAVPRVLEPTGHAGELETGALLAPGAGDNAAAALGVGARPGDAVVSIGTSVTVTCVVDDPTADATGTIAGFADATGRFLPLVCTLNGALVLDAVAGLLGVDQLGLSALALAAPPGAGGLALVPYFEGERTPNRPRSTGALHGMQLSNTAPAYLARAAIEGLLCGVADAIDALVAERIAVDRVILIGGASRSEAVRQIAPTVLGRPVIVPAPSEYVADGAARQASWALDRELETPPDWPVDALETYEAEPSAELRERYAEVRQMTLDRER